MIINPHTQIQQIAEQIEAVQTVTSTLGYTISPEMVTQIALQTTPKSAPAPLAQQAPMYTLPTIIPTYQQQPAAQPTQSVAVSSARNPKRPPLPEDQKAPHFAYLPGAPGAPNGPCRKCHTLHYYNHTKCAPTST